MQGRVRLKTENTIQRRENVFNIYNKGPGSRVPKGLLVINKKIKWAKR